MKTNYKSLIDFFGNQVKTAQALQVTQPSVNAWLKGKTKMSATVAIKAEKLTHGKFKAYELCPKLAEFKEHLNKTPQA